MITTGQKRIGIEDWIQTTLNDDDYDKPCSAMVLQHIALSGAETEIKTIKIGEGRDWPAKKLADFVNDLARGYCQDLPGIHYFKLLAFYGDNTPRARHPFCMNGQLDNHGLGTEPPSVEGRTMQKMRHEEALIQGMISERALLLDFSIRSQRAMADYQSLLMRELADTRKENLDAVQLAKEVIFEKASRDRDHEIKMKQLDRSFKERDKLLTFGPLLVNEAFGREIIPQSAIDSLTIDQLAETITPEGFEKIMATGAIPPELAGVLAARMTRVLENKRKTHEEALARGSEVDDDIPSLAEGNGRDKDSEHH